MNLKLRETGGGLSRTWIWRLALSYNFLISLALLPLTSNSSDMAAMIGPVERWISWGVTPFMFTKFGVPYDIWVAITLSVSKALGGAVLSPVALMHVLFKAPLLAANFSTAFGIRRLGSRLGWKNTSNAAMLWIVSPIAIWVAAAHGQVEPISIAFTVWSLVLLVERHWFWSGLMSGIGSGFEYFPLVVGLAVVLYIMETHLRDKTGPVRFSLGVATGIALSYGPVIMTSIGRKAVSGGLSIGEGKTLQIPTLVKFRSVWIVAKQLGFANAISLWPVIFILVSLALGYLSYRLFSLDRNSRQLVAVAVVLVWFVVAYPVTLPQFLLILQFGTLLLYGMDIVSPVFAVACPLLGYIGFFFGTSIYWYFLDIQPNIWQYFNAHVLLPVFPVNRAGMLYRILSESVPLSAYLIIVSVFHQSVARSRARWRLFIEGRFTVNWQDLFGRLSLVVTIGLSILPMVGVLIIAFQGPIVANIFKQHPAHIASYRSRVNPLVTGVSFNQSGYVRPSISVMSLKAFEEARSAPTIGLGIYVSPYTVQQYTLRPVSAGEILIPDWPDTHAVVKLLWVNLLIHANNSGISAITGQMNAYASFNGHTSESVVNSPTNQQWMSFWFEIPSSYVRPSGVINVSAMPGFTLEGGGPNGDIFTVVTPRAAVMFVDSSGKTSQRLFVGQVTGDGILSGVWNIRKGETVISWVKVSGLNVGNIYSAAFLWGNAALTHMSRQASGFVRE